jgi:hypothetical protein
MNTIEQIKTALQDHIAEAEAATLGPWKVDQQSSNERPGISTFDEKKTVVLFGLRDDDNDDGGIRGKDPEEALATAAFIAYARTMSPAACKCLLLAIEGLETISPADKIGCVPDEVITADETLEAIRQEWHNLTTTNNP